MKKITYSIYLTVLHIFLILLFLHPNFLNKLYYKLGISDYGTGHDYYQEFIWNSYAKRSKTLNKNSNQLIFFGNSITNGLCVESLFQGLNLAVSGETLQKAKEKIKKVQNLENKRIVLAYGINDIPRDNQEIMDDYKELISFLPASSTIYISSVLPLDEEAFAKHWKSKKTSKQINELNNLLKEFCQAKHNLIYLDASKYLFNSIGDLDPSFHLGDGIHLNDKGNLLWAKGLEEGLFDLSKNLISKAEK